MNPLAVIEHATGFPLTARLGFRFGSNYVTNHMVRNQSVCWYKHILVFHAF